MSQGRPRFWTRLTIAASILSLPIVVYAKPKAPLPEMLQDAELNDVFFLDHQTGWAVGERGAIWHTRDGGRHWSLQASPIACRLESVWFANDQVGWAVGGWIHPYLRRPRGVVLFTEDGGQNWEQRATPSLGALRAIRMFDARQGWAVGQASSTHPSGVVFTHDAGQSWASAVTNQPGDWRCADFFGQKRGVVAGNQGQVVTTINLNATPSQTSDWGSRDVLCLKALPGGVAWMAGRTGRALLSLDAGKSWREPAAPLPSQAAPIDFRALALHGPHVWLAGSPGGAVWHSPDGGRSWLRHGTDHELPINAMTFVDERHGWAVGSLGAVLATRDGGRTWQVQRQAEKRLAVLTIHCRPELVPLETLSLLCGEQACQGAAVVPRLANESASGAASMNDRIRQAVAATGAECVLFIDPPSPEEGPASSASSTHWLTQRLVRILRQWRPDVVITHSQRDEDPLGALFHQAAIEAVEQAADESRYPHHFADCGLAPWSVSKVFVDAELSRSAGVSVGGAQLAPQLGGSLSDHVARSRVLLELPPLSRKTSSNYLLFVNRGVEGGASRDFLSGLRLKPGGEARRRLSTPPAGALEQVRRFSQQSRNLQRLLTLKRSGGQADAWLAQVDEMTRELPPDAAARFLDQLARHYHRAGKPELAAETYESLAVRYESEPEADAAYLWLMRYYTSVEAAWRMHQSSGLAMQAAGAGLAEQTNPESGVKTVGLVTPILPEADTARRANKAIEIARKLAASRPSLHAEPEVTMQLAAAHRARGDAAEADRLCQQMASRGFPISWKVCGKGELWLAKPTPAAVKRSARCARANTSPHIDGKLDDPLWRGAAPVAFGDDDRGGEVRLAADAEYLYLAVKCRKAPATTYLPDDSPRPRDPDLSKNDRVDLLFDVNRDYSSWLRFTVDHRGWTGEACLGDRSWNPQWFVAADGDELFWTVEAVVPWREIGPRPSARDAWAMEIKRSLPDGETQLWSQQGELGAGFGFLVFD